MKTLYGILLATAFLVLSGCSTTAYKIDQQAPRSAPWQVGEVVFTASDGVESICTVKGKTQRCIYERRFLGVDTQGYYLVEDFYTPETVQNYLKNGETKAVRRTDPYLLMRKDAVTSTYSWAGGWGDDAQIQGRIAVYYLTGGKWFEGEKQSTAWQGAWILWREDGSIEIKTMLKDGRRDGVRLTSHRNGMLKTEERYKNGKREGVSVSRHENGQKREYINFKDGVPLGGWQRWYEDGSEERRVTCIEGVAECVVNEWYAGGNLKAEGHEKAGRLVGLFTMWHENGVKAQQGRSEDRGKVGIWEAWHEDGSKASQGEYINGYAAGVHSKWYANGKLEEKTGYSKDEREGGFTAWHDNGQKAMEGVYKAGEKAGVWRKWDNTGKLIEEVNHDLKSADKTKRIVLEMTLNP